MRPTRRSKLLCLLCVWLLACAPPARTQEQTRPRRVPVGPSDAARQPPTLPPPQAISTTTRLDTEPTVRIGLATAARSVTISTTATALAVVSGVSETAAPQPLAAARVRIEPRLLAPLLPENASGAFRVEIAVVESATAAEALARDVRALTGDDASVVLDAPASAWRVRVGPPLTRDEADDLRARIEEAGFAAVSVVSAEPKTTTPPANSATNAQKVGPAGQLITPSGGNARAGDTATNTRTNPAARTGSSVRLAARVAPPTRGLVVYAAGAQPLMDARA
ncbi:MAG TPA: SPOR domain-containing protein, partial [Pyrinomonadaceae bacterium]|nr:SPOR domain-containing protein [Pyrinomonadaceae bacterium]